MGVRPPRAPRPIQRERVHVRPGPGLEMELVDPAQHRHQRSREQASGPLPGAVRYQGNSAVSSVNRAGSISWGVQPSPLSRQTADQTEQGAYQAPPEPARNLGAHKCAARRRGRSSPGSTSSDIRRSRAHRLLTILPWSTTGPRGGDASNPVGQLHAAPDRPAGQPLPALRGSRAQRRPATRLAPAVGELVAGGHPQAIQHDYLVHHGRPGRPGTSDGDQTRLVHAGRQHINPARPRGLLETCAMKSGTHAPATD